jgi:Pvc16 N-terminal domain
MIQDLDDTIKQLLIEKVPINVATIDITFEMPTKEWAAGVSRPTINIFLYDIRENHELRSNEQYLARSGSTGTETRTPTRIDLTYLISAWTTDVSDEHRLLGGLLTTLLRHPVLPAEVLKGSMSSQAYPLRAWVAQPERTPNVWDFWGGLDGRLKAGISYVVTLGVTPFEPETVGLVTEKVLKLKQIG